MLTLRNMQSGYGSAQVLFDVSLEIRRGEVVTLLGRNGMGKTTTIATIMGWLPCRGGSISIDGADISDLPDHRRARLGLGLVPEGRRIFSTLSVRENLVATAASRPRWTLERTFDLFPRLQERADALGSDLSGGEQQMLAIARALMTDPWLLLLDEATEGLAPIIRDDIWRALGLLKDSGQAVLVIDKNLDALERIADRHYVIDRGHIRWSGDAAAFARERSAVERHLSVSGNFEKH
jgi:branched-chain amino acid transport system ATP-binding protein